MPRYQSRALAWPPLLEVQSAIPGVLRTAECTPIVPLCDRQFPRLREAKRSVSVLHPAHTGLVDRNLDRVAETRLHSDQSPLRSVLVERLQRTLSHISRQWRPCHPQQLSPGCPSLLRMLRSFGPRFLNGNRQLPPTGPTAQCFFSLHPSLAQIYSAYVSTPKGTHYAIFVAADRSSPKRFCTILVVESLDTSGIS